MILLPYIEPFHKELGPFTLEPFGIFVAIGVLFGVWIGGKHAKKIGLNTDVLQDSAVWALGLGTVTGHWAHLFIYHPEELSRGFFQIFKFWDGLSSMGGVIGGIVGIFIFFKRRKVNIWNYADTIAIALPAGWWIARVGCFSVHDHPGIRSNLFFAVDFPVAEYGGPRLDLGLIDAVSLLMIFGLLWFLGQRDMLKGRLSGLLALLYGIQRFLTDFLRATDLSYIDKRYFGLTFAQYFCFFLVGFGIYRLIKPPTLTPLEPQAKAKPPQPAAK